MPKTQRIIWTTLPNGFQGNTLKLSVFVSPRLYNSSDAQLSDFPDFANWPGRLNSVKFSVEFKNGPKLKANVTTNADSGLWKTIFPSTNPAPNTFVRAYKFPDLSQRVIRSFPVAGVMGYLKGVYTNAGEKSPTLLPRLRTGKGDEDYFGLNDLLDKLGQIRDRRHGRESYFEKQFDTLLMNREGARVIPPNYTPPGMTAEQFAFTQLDFFYDRKRNKNLTDEQLHPKPTPNRLPNFQDPNSKLNPKLDFHQMLAGLGDYPGVERQLGMVIDLEVPVPTNVSLSTLLASDSIRVRPEWTSPPSAFNHDFAPWTKLLAGRFLAEPRPNSELANGMLKLMNVNAQFLANSQAEFDLLQLDVDSAALKTLDFAGNMQRWLAMSRAYNAPDDGGLPSSRTCGLALVKRARAFKLASALQAMPSNNQAVENSPPDVDQNLPVLLYADDLVRGYRVDILDQSSSTAAWRSLCKRAGKYSFPNSSQTPLTINDEGYVKGASATSTVDGASDSDLYLHETMFQWEGWSLCAPRPGKTIVAENYDSSGKPLASPRINEYSGKPLQSQTENVKPSPNSSAGIPGVNIETSFAPQPGTLPRLRFGHVYRLRVRSADIAGNSLPAESTDDSQASQEHFFARFDPVIPPALVLRDRVSDGESVERMVIRSNYDKKVSDYIASPEVKDAIKKKQYQYHETNERHIAPSKTSQQMAELHGKFDDFIGFDAASSTRKDYDKGYKLALKESGTFLDTEVYDPSTDSKTTVTGIELVTPASVPLPAATLPLDPPGRALSPGQYVIHKEDNLLLPYLPDPFARGAAFVGIPNVSGAGPIASDPGAVKVQLTSLDPAHAKEPYSVLKVPFNGAWPDATPFMIRIVEGSGEPVWKGHVLTVFLPKATIARVRYSSYLDGGDLKQMGIWQWIATQPQLAPYALAGQHWMLTPFRQLELVHAVQQPLTEPKFDKMQALKLRIGDTFAVFRGFVDLSVKSTAKIEVLGKWKEWMDSLSEPGPRQLSLEGRAFELKIEENANDLFNVPPVSKVIGAGSPDVRHEFHDTKYRAVDYSIVATTRFREYFPPEITDDPKNITRVSTPEPFKVLNSARPAAPKVLYVVPTFKWEPSVPNRLDHPHDWGTLPPSPGQRTVESKRIGRGLRVYLERPWYSSGDEEKLGVVLREAPRFRIGIRESILGVITGTSAPSGPPPPDPLKPFVTQWGMDPIWDSELPKPWPRPEDFKLASVPPGSGLTLDELSGVTVAVAGHDVEYDADRKLWFCDMEIDAGPSYYPFVRLALARYQPNSIPNAHLSRVVLADFAQLTPDRTASVTFNPDNILSVSVTGMTYKASGVDLEEIRIPREALIMAPEVAPEAARELELMRPVLEGIQTRTRGGSQMWISFETQAVTGDLGWMPVPRSDVRLFPTPGPGGLTVWSGRIQLPADLKDVKLRLVIREYEWFIADPKATRLDKRIVYADVLEL